MAMVRGSGWLIEEVGRDGRPVIPHYRAARRERPANPAIFLVGRVARVILKPI
jgi:hypothetical protein